jgi:hypothetical protein
MRGASVALGLFVVLGAVGSMEVGGSIRESMPTVLVGLLLMFLGRRSLYGR